MPYTTNTKIKIHYEVIGTGMPLLFHHPNGNCIQDWHDLGYVEKLKKHCQLILIDARGYGKSDKPHDPKAYSMQLKASDTIAVMDELGISQACCFGYSMGGRTVFALMKFYPERFNAYIIGGAHPYGSSGIADTMRQWLPKGISYIVEQSEKFFGPFPKQVRDNYLKNDIDALIAANTQPASDISDCLNNTKAACLLYVGSKDPIDTQVQQCNAQLAHSQLHILPGLNHLQVYWRSELVAPLIIGFLNKCSNK